MGILKDRKRFRKEPVGFFCDYLGFGEEKRCLVENYLKLIKKQDVTEDFDVVSSLDKLFAIRNDDLHFEELRDHLEELKSIYPCLQNFLIKAGENLNVRFKGLFGEIKKLKGEVSNFMLVLGLMKKGFSSLVQNYIILNNESKAIIAGNTEGIPKSCVNNVVNILENLGILNIEDGSFKLTDYGKQFLPLSEDYKIPDYNKKMMKAVSKWENLLSLLQMKHKPENKFNDYTVTYQKTRKLLNIICDNPRFVAELDSLWNNIQHTRKGYPSHIRSYTDAEKGVRNVLRLLYKVRENFL
jgi:hypothetical protein